MFRATGSHVEAFGQATGSGSRIWRRWRIGLRRVSTRHGSASGSGRPTERAARLLLGAPVGPAQACRRAGAARWAWAVAGRHLCSCAGLQASAERAAGRLRDCGHQAALCGRRRRRLLSSCSSLQAGVVGGLGLGQLAAAAPLLLHGSSRTRSNQAMTRI